MAEESGATLDPADLEQEHEDDLPGLEIKEAPEDAQVSEPSEAEEEEVGPLGQSSRVGFWGVSCSGGAWSSFLIPITTYPYVARFVFVNAAGARKYSAFRYHNRSEYPGFRIWAQWQYALPVWPAPAGGTKHVYAYWWCGTPGDSQTPPAYWNYVNTNC
jgi:hypothetical protein